MDRGTFWRLEGVVVLAKVVARDTGAAVGVSFLPAPGRLDLDGGCRHIPQTVARHTRGRGLTRLSLGTSPEG